MKVATADGVQLKLTSKQQETISTNQSLLFMHTNQVGELNMCLSIIEFIKSLSLRADEQIIKCKYFTKNIGFRPNKIITCFSDTFFSSNGASRWFLFLPFYWGLKTRRAGGIYVFPPDFFPLKFTTVGLVFKCDISMYISVFMFYVGMFRLHNAQVCEHLNNRYNDIMFC